MQSMVFAKVMILAVNGFALLEALQFDSLLLTRRGGPTLDLSSLNATLDAVKESFVQVNTTVGDMSTPMVSAAETWTTQLGTLADAYTTISAATVMFGGGDDQIGECLKALIPQLNASLTLATDQLPAATVSVQKLLTEALSEFTTLSDKTYAALTKANEKVAEVSTSGVASLRTVMARKHIAISPREVGKKAKIAAAGKKAAKAKVSKKHRRLMPRRKKLKPARVVALLGTRAAAPAGKKAAKAKVSKKHRAKQTPRRKKLKHERDVSLLQLDTRAAAPAGKKTAKAKVSKKHRAKQTPRRKQIKHERGVALLETRAAQNFDTADQDLSTMDRAVARKGGSEPDSSIAAANKTIKQLGNALAGVGGSTVTVAFGTIAAAMTTGLDAFNSTAQKALATAGTCIAAAGGAQGVVAQTAVDGVKASLALIISTVQAGILDANTTGLTTVTGLITGANTSLQEVSAIAASLQQQADAAKEAAAAAKNASA